MTLHSWTVGSLTTVLVTANFALTDLTGGTAGIAKMLFYISAGVFAGLLSAELVVFLRRVGASLWKKDEDG